MTIHQTFYICLITVVADSASSIQKMMPYFQAAAQLDTGVADMLVLFWHPARSARMRRVPLLKLPVGPRMISVSSLLSFK